MPVLALTNRPHDLVVRGETRLTFLTDGVAADSLAFALLRVRHPDSVRRLGHDLFA
jgi:hypothetical protein